jgi:hypothetical protein
LAANNRYKKDTQDYFNQDSARQERIQELQKTLNYTERGEKRTRQAKKSKPVEIVPCPRQIGNLPLVEWEPGYIINKEQVEEFASGARVLPEEPRDQVNATDIIETWDYFVNGYDMPWNMANFEFEVWYMHDKSDSRITHHP